MPTRVFLTALWPGPPAPFLTWTVPADWDSAHNTIECLGASGDGGNNASGGGGGAYSMISNLALTPGASITYFVGATLLRADGQDTWFNGASFAGSSVGAKGGQTGNAKFLPTVAFGGQASACIGTLKYSGGNGGGFTTGGFDGEGGGGGGGGAAGPGGAGGHGGNGHALITGPDPNGGGGGGANGGAFNGVDATAGASGAGGNGNGGSGGGAGAAGGSSISGGTGFAGGGGGGGASNFGAGGGGGSDTAWDMTHGCGGGTGGGAGFGTSAPAAALYGGGGGGGPTGSPGAQGIIVITYGSVTPPPTLLVSCGSPPVGVVAQPYSFTVPASGGVPPYTFSVIAGALPPGLTIDPVTGIISGVPTTPGSSFFYTIQVVDSTTPTPQTATTGSCIGVIAPHIAIRISRCPIIDPQTTYGTTPSVHDFVFVDCFNSTPFVMDSSFVDNIGYPHFTAFGRVRNPDDERHLHKALKRAWDVADEAGKTGIIIA